MKKNVIWWPAVKNKDHSDKYGNFDYFEYSRKTWEFWCKKNDVLFVPFEKPVEQDLHEYRINWQKAIFVFDELERRGIDYDQIALVDSTVMVKWDCPNFFELTDRKFTVTRDIDNMSWTRDSILGYKDFFDGFELDSTKYFRSGFMVFNETHRDFFTQVTDFYNENADLLRQVEKEWHAGTDQTPVNILIHDRDVDFKWLPYEYNMCDMTRKELLTDDLLFTKWGWIYQYNSIPNNKEDKLTYYWMKKTYEYLYD